MDSKDRYSAGVTAQNILSNQNEVLREAIGRSWNRRHQYDKNWQSVNINEIVQRFAPDAVPYEKGVKIHWKSPTTGYEVLADVSGYLRIKDLNPGPYKGTFLDINGNHIEALPRLDGESRSAYDDRKMRLSHFTILKREKMK